MATRYYSSVAAETTLVASITNGNTSIQVASATGLPALTPFTLALDYEAAVEELVEVTAVAGTTLTVTRGIDGTSAAAHNAGARVRHVSSARDFADSRTHESTATNVHGLAVGSAVVGTNDTQTLSNKTLNNATGTLNRVDIFAEGVTPWVTTVNGDIDHVADLMKWNRGPSETHEVTKVTNNGAVMVRNQNAAADSTFSTYRFRATKDDGTTDIFSVLSGGTATSWTNSGQSGFIVKPRTTDNDVAIRIRNSVDSADTFAVWNNGRVDVNGSDPAFSQLDVHGASGQSAACMRVMNNDETVTHFQVSGAGNTSVNGNLSVGGNTSLTGTLSVTGAVTLPITTVTSGITYATGFAAGSLLYKSEAGSHFLNVNVQRSGATFTPANTSGNVTPDLLLCTLPAGTRPAVDLYVLASTGIGHGSVRINTDGTCELLTWIADPVTITNGSTIRFTASWIN